MSLFNFESIIAIIFLVLSFFVLNSTISRKKKLGELVLPTLSGMAHSDILLQTVLVLLLAGFTAFSVLYGSSSKNYTLFYIAFPIALAVYYANSLINAFSKKGMYKNGIYASNGILSYEEVTEYLMKPNAKKDVVRIKINPKGSFLGSTAWIEIEPSKEPEMKGYMKKHCSFKKKSNTPPPRPKKKK